ncbi:MAG: mandelate racemase/muconate lactonizing enzyme family protein [Opitutaceae bacterium]|jgi:L-alanine-DL-glutamate epimerase-like enolase superfamily enzyme|nr:mandelate racemase/muconate lactonizing enzyme family protein [Opitutaceae bacterium]
MKITSVSIRLVRQGAESWHAPRPVPADDYPWFDFPFITIGTDGGVEGYTMEYCPLGQGRATAYGIKDIFQMDLLGQNPLHHEKIWQRLRAKQRHLYNTAPTLASSLDVALWDIKGKVAGQPVASMLGLYRDKVPLYATCPPQDIATSDDVEAAVRAKIAEGFAGVKLQLSGGAARDIPRLERARAVAGAGYPLMVDSSATLTFEDALKMGRALDDLEYEWFEEPFPDAHVMQLKKLADAIRTPVLAAETVSLFDLPQYMTGGAVDMVRGDVHHKGGITGLMKALGMCEMMGIALEIHTAATPLLDVANLHAGCATRMSRFLESHHPMFRLGLKNDPLRVHADGCQHVPAGPGLGVEIDWDWIDNHTVELIK